jgi:hypothetical protein
LQDAVLRVKERPEVFNVLKVLHVVSLMLLCTFWDVQISRVRHRMTDADAADILHSVGAAEDVAALDTSSRDISKATEESPQAGKLGRAGGSGGCIVVCSSYALRERELL